MTVWPGQCQVLSALPGQSAHTSRLAPLRPALAPPPQDWRVSVVEAALQFLADCACLAGAHESYNRFS